MKKATVKVLMQFALILALICCAGAQASEIPEAGITVYNSIDTPLSFNGDKTIELNGVTFKSTGNQGSPIVVESGTLNLILSGENTLEGNDSTDDSHQPIAPSAGIEVKEGATLHIYAREGGSLTVTGGQYGAGIGGVGYGGASADNSKAGNIIIHSGNITAIGGDRGAGIGSGYHSSASEITILGGNITAFGTGCGAGIGSGYGSSGGGSAQPVGFYNGGNITISGGTVRAAAYHLNFDQFDPYDPQILYGEGYKDTFAAGIGGGYGASSGNIIIEGDADVTAVGSSGGAGIGTGRGTSKPGYFDSDKANVDITIRGNTRVTAMATKDTRLNYPQISGAGIGTGCGWFIEGTPKGSIKIEGNANVYALADAYANGIGTGWAVTRINPLPDPPTGPSLATLQIAPTCTVVAISDGHRAAIEETKLPLAGMATLSIQEEIDDKFDVVLAESGQDTGVKIPVTAPRQIAVQIPGNTAPLSFLNDQYLLLGEGTEKSWRFAVGGNAEQITEIVPRKAYAFAATGDTTLQPGKDATFTVKRDGDDNEKNLAFRLFDGLRMDGADPGEGNHTETPGSVVITLKAAYLDSLPAGSHTLTALFADGSAQLTLTKPVASATVPPSMAGAGMSDVSGKVWKFPKTGDSSPLGLWAGMAVFGALGIAALVLTNKRKNKK